MPSLDFLALTVPDPARAAAAWRGLGFTGQVYGQWRPGGVALALPLGATTLFLGAAPAAVGLRAPDVTGPAWSWQPEGGQRPARGGAGVCPPGPVPLGIWSAPAPADPAAHHLNRAGTLRLVTLAVSDLDAAVRQMITVVGPGALVPGEDHVAVLLDGGAVLVLTRPEAAGTLHPGAPVPAPLALVAVGVGTEDPAATATVLTQRGHPPRQDADQVVRVVSEGLVCEFLTDT